MKNTAYISFISDTTLSALEARRKCTALYGNVPIRDADVIVALGGDGLMLHTIIKQWGRHLFLG